MKNRGQIHKKSIYIYITLILNLWCISNIFLSWETSCVLYIWLGRTPRCAQESYHGKSLSASPTIVYIVSFFLFWCVNKGFIWLFLIKIIELKYYLLFYFFLLFEISAPLPTLAPLKFACRGTNCIGRNLPKNLLATLRLKIAALEQLESHL